MLGRTALVMMDTRPARLPPGSKPLELEHPQLAFELNKGYACHHGYDLLYLRMQSTTCQHSRLGERNPSYCKLAAVAEALHRGYTLVAFMDSDAFFRNLSLSLPQVMHEYRDLRNDARREAVAVSFAADRPYSFGPNAGVQFWRNTAEAARLLRLWWHLPGGRYHLEHDFEQHALQWSLLPLETFRGSLETLRLESMATTLDERSWPAYRYPLAHIDHGRHFYRHLVMCVELLNRAGQPPQLPAGRARHKQGSGGAKCQGSNHCKGKGRGRPKEGSLARRARRRAKNITGPGPGGGRRGKRRTGAAAADAAPVVVEGRRLRGEGKTLAGHRTATLRQRLLKQVWRLMKAGLRDADGTPTEPSATGADAAQPAGSAAASAERIVHDLAVGVPGSCALSRVIEAPFDPTARAAAILGTGTVSPGALGASSAGAVDASTATIAPTMPIDGYPWWALEGLPLRLVNCSVRTRAEGSHWWMSWRNDSGQLELLSPSPLPMLPAASPPPPPAVASSSDAARRRLCVHIGPARAPRQPDFALAQLLECMNSTATASGFPGASSSLAPLARAPAPMPQTLQHFRYDAAARTINTPGRSAESLTSLFEGGAVSASGSAYTAAGAAASLLKAALGNPPAEGEEETSPSFRGMGRRRRLEQQQPQRQPARQQPAEAGGAARVAAASYSATLDKAQSWLAEHNKDRDSTGTRHEVKYRTQAEWNAAMRSQKLTPRQLGLRKKRRERLKARRSQWMGQSCASVYTGKGDKTFEDCEDWCDEGKIGHCRYCKCRGCKHCHGDLSLPDWIYNTPGEMQCASFGICLNTTTYPLCLSVWRGEVHDGAAVVWSRCRSDVCEHQQWQLRPAVDGGGGAARGDAFRVELASSSQTEPLCVAAPVAASLISG